MLRTVTFTLLALVAFASNSLLARLSLGTAEIDAATFTAIRLIAGAAVLLTLARLRDGAWTALRGDKDVVGATRTNRLVGPGALFVYAVPFSLAYVRIGAAVGALVLFGVVQLTMVGYGLASGERPSPRTWAGLALASSGLVVLTAPAATRPDPLGVALMALSGAAWAVYTLAGRTSHEPVAANAHNFLWSSPLALLVVFALPGSIVTSTRGVVLALVSGGVTSGLGYVLWYRALPRLSVTQAAVAQVGVPVIAAVGGVVLLGEPLGLRLILAGAAVLGGIGLLLSRRRRPATA